MKESKKDPLEILDPSVHNFHSPECMHRVASKLKRKEAHRDASHYRKPHVKLFIDLFARTKELSEYSLVPSLLTFYLYR